MLPERTVESIVKEEIQIYKRIIYSLTVGPEEAGGTSDSILVSSTSNPEASQSTITVLSSPMISKLWLVTDRPRRCRRSLGRRRHATMGVMGSQRFRAVIAAGPQDSAVIAVPFDPDEAWGAKADHPVSGTIGDCRTRTRLVRARGVWVLTLAPKRLLSMGIAIGDQVTVELAPEGPQRGDLADDIAAALAANPAAGAFFDTLAQFYRKAYLRWIDATRRRPELRAARIAEVVGLLAAGIKERPRS